MNDIYDFYGGPCDGLEAWHGINPPNTRTVSDFGCKHMYRLVLKDGQYVYEFIKTVQYCSKKFNSYVINGESNE